MKNNSISSLPSTPSYGVVGAFDTATKNRFLTVNATRNLPICARGLRTSESSVLVFLGRAQIGGLRGCLKPTISKTVTYRLPHRRGHNIATQATHALDASEPFSHSATYAPHAIHDSAPEGRVTTLQAAAAQALALGLGPNCMWNLARALKGFEKNTKSRPELGSALSFWWIAAKMPDESLFNEYLCDLQDCFSRVKTALGDNALALAEQALPPLPVKPTFDDRLNRLKALCAALQAHAGRSSFFLSLRDVGRITGNTDPYASKKMLNFLVTGGSLKLIEKGQLSGRKASRFTYNPRQVSVEK